MGKRLTAVGALALVTSCWALSGSAAEVWVEPATSKVLKDATAEGKAESAVVEAARNEYEGFQVVIAGGESGLAGVSVELSDLAGPAGVTIAAGTSVNLYLEHYHYIEKPSPCDIFFSTDCDSYPAFQRKPGYYPDALIPFQDPYSEDHGPVAAPFDVAAGDLETVFVDLHVPADASAGEYAGQVEVTAGDEVLAQFPVTLVVWDFQIPVQRNVATAYGFGGNHVKKYHGGPEGPTPEEEATLLRNYEWAVHAHRMDYTTHNPGLSFEFDESDNLLPVDFAAYEAYMGPRIDGSYYPDGAGVNRYNLGMFRPGHGTMGMTEEQYAVAAKAVAEHLEGLGYLDHVYLYSLDEPWMIEHWQSGSYEKIQKTIDLLNKHTALWQGHVLITGPWQEIISDCGDIWCPVTPMYGDVFWPSGSWPGREKYQELLAQGKELWFYVCNANFPGQMGYDIDSPLGHEPRLVKWGAWYEGATGFLYWRMTYWFTSDPWHDLANGDGFGEQFSRNGDGILIYPGDHDGTAGGTGSPQGISIDGPVLSLRMKQIRDGLEDWELFILADSLGAGEYARAQVESVYRAFGAPLNADFDITTPPWSLDDAELLAARRQVALKVQHLTHPDLYDDPEAPPPVEPEPYVVEEAATAPDLAEALPDVSGGAEVIASDVVEEAEPRKKKSGGCQTGMQSPSTAGLLPILIALLWLIRRLNLARRAGA